MSAWTDEEIALGFEVWKDLFTSTPLEARTMERFIAPLNCGALPATTLIPLRAARLALPKARLEREPVSAEAFAWLQEELDKERAHLSEARSYIQALKTERGELRAQRAEALSCGHLAVSFDGDTHWLECFINEPEGEDGEVIHPIEAGDTWRELLAKVAAHTCAPLEATQ